MKKQGVRAWLDMIAKRQWRLCGRYIRAGAMGQICPLTGIERRSAGAYLACAAELGIRESVANRIAAAADGRFLHTTDIAAMRRVLEQRLLKQGDG